nr:MAG TPA_asm: NMD3 family [Caudoviricetes sp.]DAW56048.1 MAG TPA: NMD3 family [Caudoviricetes sp.]
MSETDYGCYCKKCFLKKHKLSKKNINRIVFTPYVEECDGCGKVEKLVDYVEDEDNEW